MLCLMFVLSCVFYLYFENSAKQNKWKDIVGIFLSWKKCWCESPIGRSLGLRFLSRGEQNAFETLRFIHMLNSRSFGESVLVFESSFVLGDIFVFNFNIISNMKVAIVIQEAPVPFLIHFCLLICISFYDYTVPYCIMTLIPKSYN